MSSHVYDRFGGDHAGDAGFGGDHASDARGRVAFDVRAWFDAIGRADLVRLRAMATDDMVVATLGPSALSGMRGFDEFAENLSILSEVTKSGVDFEITELIDAEDRIAVELVGRAELADGSVFDEVHFLVLHLRDGRLCLMKKYSESELVESVFGALVRRGA